MGENHRGVAHLLLIVVVALGILALIVFVLTKKGKLIPFQEKTTEPRAVITPAKTNPFDTYKNPFEEYQNPFSQFAK